jgi:hypothetical protein
MKEGRVPRPFLSSTSEGLSKSPSPAAAGGSGMDRGCSDEDTSAHLDSQILNITLTHASYLRHIQQLQGAGDEGEKVHVLHPVQTPSCYHHAASHCATPLKLNLYSLRT